MKEEVQELQTTLKEEQFYSTELKKEVERLSTAVHKSTEEQTVETSEIDLYETQIKALSEAKDLRKFKFLAAGFWFMCAINAFLFKVHRGWVKKSAPTF